MASDGMVWVERWVAWSAAVGKTKNCFFEKRKKVWRLARSACARVDDCGPSADAVQCRWEGEGEREGETRRLAPNAEPKSNKITSKDSACVFDNPQTTHTTSTLFHTTHPISPAVLHSGTVPIHNVVGAKSVY